ncbi:uncharacterized protein LOC112583974 isoform X2 [Bubalus bubalis]|uniref:uncharacterized protein LOC112583974 isoform X2 n=1 Tax=Bubalus bubalis TaxID=89462 RepID=UPI001E1B8583|nr:uncharacterized protein LOC112583974 isoform X2 [Bubalus bubalis]
MWGLCIPENAFLLLPHMPCCLYADFFLLCFPQNLKKKSCIVLIAVSVWGQSEDIVRIVNTATDWIWESNAKRRSCSPQGLQTSGSSRVWERQQLWYKEVPWPLERDFWSHLGVLLRTKSSGKQEVRRSRNEAPASSLIRLQTWNIGFAYLSRSSSWSCLRLVVFHATQSCIFSL